MVKIFGEFILQHYPNSKPIVLSSYVESTGWYSWFYNDQLTELTRFLSKFLAEKVQPGYRQQFEKDELVGYVQKTKSGLVCVLVTDKDYPFRVAFDLVRHTLRDFSDWLMETSFTTFSKDNECLAYNTTLQRLVQEFQDPTQADKILKIKKDLEETKEVLNQTLEKLLDRGQTLESLIEQTNELSESGKEFYRKTKKSKCCNIL
ncbi:hypothetical protein ABK040_010935 [Willaertia magna]